MEEILREKLPPIEEILNEDTISEDEEIIKQTDEREKLDNQRLVKRIEYVIVKFINFLLHSTIFFYFLLFLFYLSLFHIIFSTIKYMFS